MKIIQPNNRTSSVSQLVSPASFYRRKINKSKHKKLKTLESPTTRSKGHNMAKKNVSRLKISSGPVECIDIGITNPYNSDNLQSVTFPNFQSQTNISNPCGGLVKDADKKLKKEKELNYSLLDIKPVIVKTNHKHRRNNLDSVFLAHQDEINKSFTASSVLNLISEEYEDINPGKSKSRSNALSRKSLHGPPSKNQDKPFHNILRNEIHLDEVPGTITNISVSGPFRNTKAGNNTCTTYFHELCPSTFLVVMKPESLIHLVGIIQVEVVKGSIEVFGSTLSRKSENTPKILIFSPLGSSHLSIKANKNECSDIIQSESYESIYKVLIGNILGNALQEEKDQVLFIARKDLSHVSSTVWPIFFESHLSFSIFPATELINKESSLCCGIEHKTDCLFFDENQQSTGFKYLKQIPEWLEIERNIKSQDCPKVILCGGKAVGKSTLLRFIINKCLEKWDNILVLDFDLGQCEFTVPGCISLTLVQEPLLGPNFCHLKEPFRCVFLGEVDVTKCPGNYIAGCKSLIEEAQIRYNNIPWIINTMGFTRGFGVTLNCGIIRSVSPTHVIQIDSKDRKLNYPAKLIPTFVNDQDVGAFSSAKNVPQYKLFLIPSGSEQNGGAVQKPRGISPAESRNLVILSYLSEMLNSETLNLSQVIPYMVKMEAVELQTTDKCNLTKTQVATAMNGNLIALCQLKNSNSGPNCYGFGIVRGIDWNTNTMFVITPLPNKTLKRINCLVKGNISLPESLRFNQGEEVTGHIPYMARTSNSLTSRFAKRDFRILPTRGQER